MERMMQRFRELFRKNRAAMLVLLVGFLFILLPSEKKESAVPKTPEEPVLRQETLEARLEEILMEVAGAGKVRVLLTQACGEENIYQLDEQEITDGERRELRRNTVTVTQSDRQQGGLLTKVEAAQYRGAVVVCQGGDNPTVRLSVVEAVSGATGLPSNRITVLKMK